MRTMRMRVGITSMLAGGALVPLGIWSARFGDDAGDRLIGTTVAIGGASIALIGLGTTLIPSTLEKIHADVVRRRRHSNDSPAAILADAERRWRELAWLHGCQRSRARCGAPEVDCTRPRSMKTTGPLQFLVLLVAGWLQRSQANAIAYLLAENRLLRDRLGDKRLRLSDADKRLLAEKGRPVGQGALRAIASLATPETIFRWHRELVAKKYDGSRKRSAPGKPKTRDEIEQRLLAIAREPDVGLHAPARRDDEPRSRPRTQHSRAHSPRQRHRAGAAPRTDDVVEDVPRGAPRRDRRRRLLQRRGAHAGRARPLPRNVSHRPEDPPRPRCRDLQLHRRRVHSPSRQEPHRVPRGLPQRSDQEADRGSRSALHRAVREDLERRGRRAPAAPCAEPELEMRSPRGLCVRSRRSASAR